MAFSFWRDADTKTNRNLGADGIGEIRGRTQSDAELLRTPRGLVETPEKGKIFDFWKRKEKSESKDKTQSPKNTPPVSPDSKKEVTRTRSPTTVEMVDLSNSPTSLRLRQNQNQKSPSTPLTGPKSDGPISSASKYKPVPEGKTSLLSINTKMSSI